MSVSLYASMRPSIQALLVEQTIYVWNRAVIEPVQLEGNDDTEYNLSFYYVINITCVKLKPKQCYILYGWNEASKHQNMWLMFVVVFFTHILKYNFVFFPKAHTIMNLRHSFIGGMKCKTHTNSF